jgi:hypothetical protein
MLRPTLASMLLPLVFGAVACAILPVGPAQGEAPCTEHAWYADLAASTDSGLRVVVLLVREPSATVGQLQDRLLLALEGTEYELLRRSDNFPIVTLWVGEDAFCRLTASPLVEGMQRDDPEPAGEG